MLFKTDSHSDRSSVLDKAIQTERDCATPQSTKDFDLLRRHRGGFSLETQPELLHYASILLRAQDRVDEVSQSEILFRGELIWTALYPHLQAAGYTLPLRYAPLKIQIEANKPPAFGRLNRTMDLLHYGILSAVCAETGHRVVLMITCSRPNTPRSHELEILRMLNEEPIRSHPDNYAVRLLDVVDFPRVEGQPRTADLHIIVMPLLDHLDVIDCAINGFALHLMRQSFRVIAFLHSLGICHRDIGSGNLMSTSGDRSPYEMRLIDFGFSQQFDMRQGPITVQWYAGQTALPEVKANRQASYDPFSAEIFALAKTWQRNALGGTLPTDAVDLLERMTSVDPAARPSAAECVHGLERALAHVPIWTQCLPTNYFMFQFNMVLWDELDFLSCMKQAWQYARTVSKYVSCRGWQYLRRTE